MKKCIRCNTEKPLTEFNKNKAKKDGYQSNCRACGNAQSKNHYNNNRSDYYDRNDKRVKRIKEYINEFKGKTPCSCGEDRVPCLQFHHLDPSDKDFSVSQAIINHYGIERIQAEMDKCIVMCSNCHLLLHHEERSAD